MCLSRILVSNQQCIQFKNCNWKKYTFSSIMEYLVLSLYCQPNLHENGCQHLTLSSDKWEWNTLSLSLCVVPISWNTLWDCLFDDGLIKFQKVQKVPHCVALWGCFQICCIIVSLFLCLLVFLHALIVVILWPCYALKLAFAQVSSLPKWKALH